MQSKNLDIAIWQPCLGVVRGVGGGGGDALDGEGGRLNDLTVVVGALGVWGSCAGYRVRISRIKITLEPVRMVPRCR